MGTPSSGPSTFARCRTGSSVLRRPSASRLDLRDFDACQRATHGVDEVYNLAADMGGVGYLTRNRALCMLSVLINANLLRAAHECAVGRYFYASSACVYPVEPARPRRP